MSILNSPSFQWYSNLNVHQKINLKSITRDLLGMSWTDLDILFTANEKISIIHNKLILEGIIK
jgi:hypothetical protein